MRFHEFNRLHEHAARTAARVEDAAFVRGEHFDEELDDAAGRVELTAFLALSTGEFAEEIFIDAPDDVLGTALLVAQPDGGDEVNDAAETLLVQMRAGVFFGQDAFERGVVALDGDHGAIEQLADGRVFGAALQVRPSGFGRHPEDVVGGVFVAVFGVGAFFLLQRGVPLLECVGDVFQENQAQDNVFVFGGVEVAAEFVSGSPKRRLEAKGGAVGGFFLSSFDFWHFAAVIGRARNSNRKAVHFNLDQGEFKHRREEQ